MTIECGLYALGSLASAALTDSGPYPRTGWLAAGLCAQAVLGVFAVALLVASRATARAQRAVARLGWVVTALSVACVITATLLGRPA